MITVVTPTIVGREELLAECRSSVRAAGLAHLVELDANREGPAAVRNRLADRVETEWLLPVDDDDLIEADYVSLVAPYLDGADVIYTDWLLSGAGSPGPEPGPFDPNKLRRYNFIPVTACVRADLFRKVGGFPIDKAIEDHALWLNLLDAGARFVHAPVRAWHYRRRRDSRTGL